MTKRFTENQLGQVYLGMYQDYTSYLNTNGATALEIHDSISAKLFYSLNDPNSSLYDLPEAEKQRVWAVYQAFIQSTPSFINQYRDKKNQQQFWNDFAQKQRAWSFQTPPSVVVNKHYCAHNTLLDWLLLDSFLNSFNRPRGNYGQTHYHRHKEKKNNGELICYLILLALMTFAVAASLIALYYILKECLDSAERFIFNEGQLKAAISLSSIVGGAAAGGLFGTFIASMPIIMFGIAAGVSNPVGLAITGVVCITIISAAISCGLTNWMQNKAIQHQNKDALDSRDPYRYALSEKEEANLIAKGYDIYTVKIAIVALRKEIGEQGVPSLLNRIFTTKGEEKQKSLDLIRKIKQGNLESQSHCVTVGNMEFNFRKPNFYAPLNNSYYDQSNSVYAAKPTKRSEGLFKQPLPAANFTPYYYDPNQDPNLRPSAPPEDNIPTGLYPQLPGYNNYTP